MSAASTVEQPTTSEPMQHHPTSQQRPVKRGSFSAFQWEGGPGMFGSGSCGGDVDILSLPMLPSILPEPTYRQHRSLSFSMGQDPTNFGYDDYEDDRSSKSILSTTLEEDDDLVDQMSRLRMRSRSSGASSTGPLTPWSRFHFQQSQQQRQGAEQQQEDYFMNYSRFQPMLGYEFTDPFHRRPSLPFVFPDQSHSDMSSVLNHRRCSQSALPLPLPPLSLSMVDPSSPLPSPSSPGTSAYIPPPHLQKVPEESPITSKPQPIQPPHPHKAPSSPYVVPMPATLNKKDQKLYMVEFKAGRTEFFYLEDDQIQPRVDDLVIVEADRGKDLGKVAMCALTQEQVALLRTQKKQQNEAGFNMNGTATATTTAAATDDHSSQSAPAAITGDLKRIYRLAAPDDINQLLVKEQDEQNALAVCQQKIKQRKLRMDVVDAEYQWDRRKLTFYFIAERRIDFRELVRELFKVYKTRIWMCAVNPTPNKTTSSSSSS
ncbi:PSP1 C-terminal conserved region-domain-containing protein [Dichotomocladium elegans]|nr:PSP1 C-terminal conserved region-domain-containing protein [Dichotomocladium elegans]